MIRFALLRAKLADWIAPDFIRSTYEAGYEHGYAAADVPEEAWRDEYEKGYAAGHHDGRLEEDCI